MRIIISWLADVNEKYGPIMVLIIIVVLVALAVGVSRLSGIGVGDIATWVAGLGGN